MYDSFYRARACTQAFSYILIGHTSSGENKCFSLPLAQRVIVSLFHESTASTHTILLHAHRIGNFGISVLIRRHCEAIRRMYNRLGPSMYLEEVRCLPGETFSLQSSPLAGEIRVRGSTTSECAKSALALGDVCKEQAVSEDFDHYIRCSYIRAKQL